MKLNDRYWIYEMECIPSGKKYIGKTGSPNPCWRWANQFVNLRNNICTSRLLQEEWNKYPEIIHWQFRTLVEVHGKVNANHKEAELILETPEEIRLNMKNTSTVSLERKRRVLELLDSGAKYTDICEEVGISGGMITKIKKAR